jgi:hypothetical protein
MNWKDILAQIKSIRHPISLAALVVMVLYGIYKLVLGLPVFNEIGEERTFQFLDRVSFYIFILALIAIILGISRSLIYTWLTTTRKPVTERQFATLEPIPKDQLDQHVQFFVNDIGLETTPPARFSDLQGGAYLIIWKVLQGLRLAGDDLWEKPNDENLLAFVNRLHETKQHLKLNEIYFDDEDLEKLWKLLEHFERYRWGKVNLLEVGDKGDIQELRKDYERHERSYPSNDPFYYPGTGTLEGDIRQILMDENAGFKKQYEELLDKIRVSIRKKLSK